MIMKLKTYTYYPLRTAALQVHPVRTDLPDMDCDRSPMGFSRSKETATTKHLVHKGYCPEKVEVNMISPVILTKGG
jgi:hypothetical protein